MSEDNKTILIEVLQGTQESAGGCSCCSGGCPSAGGGCGADMDYAELTAQMSEEFKNVYGDKVNVKYVDVDKEGLDKYPVMSQVLHMGYPYPITLIDGQPKFAGGIMTKEVKEVIEETLSAK